MQYVTEKSKYEKKPTAVVVSTHSQKKVHHKAINPKPIFKLCWFLSFSGFSPLGNLAALLDLSNIWQHFCYAALRVVGGILQGIWHFVVVGLDSGEEIHGLWFAFKCRGRFLDALQVRTAVSPAAQGMGARSAPRSSFILAKKWLSNATMDTSYLEPTGESVKRTEVGVELYQNAVRY